MYSMRVNREQAVGIHCFQIIFALERNQISAYAALLQMHRCIFRSFGSLGMPALFPSLVSPN